MGLSYVENLVKAKEKKSLVLLKVVLLLLTLYGSFLVILVGNMYALIVALPALVGWYMARLFQNVEYEYLYLDREIKIDRILNMSKRKTIDTLYIDRINILAPIDSKQLDSYKHAKYKVKNYSAAKETEELKHYVMIYGDTEKIYISITETFVKAVRSRAGRKVFME